MAVTSFMWFPLFLAALPSSSQAIAALTRRSSLGDAKVKSQNTCQSQCCRLTY
jgi:hypothetical protein